MSEIRKIENFAAPELDVYARLSEPQLLHYYEPQPGLFLAESPRVIERALDAGYEPVSFLAGSAELAVNEALFAHCPDAPVYTAIPLPFRNPFFLPPVPFPAPFAKPCFQHASNFLVYLSF